MGLKQTEQPTLLFSHVFMREFECCLNNRQHCLFLTLSVVGKSRHRKRKCVCSRGGNGKLPLRSGLVNRTNTEHSGLLETVRGPIFSKPVWWCALYLSLNMPKSTSSKIHLNIPLPPNNYVESEELVGKKEPCLYFIHTTQRKNRVVPT